jgi:AcrR family transcriptional regulator
MDTEFLTPAGSDLRQVIKDTAWQQIAQHGAAALSLRAIARQLGITAPAIYNYFRRRDDLVTALIKDAYLSFGDAQQAAIQDLPAEDYPLQLITLGLNYREWAVAFPERYQLIFGTPIAGYHAPLDEILPAAARSLSFLIRVLASAREAGRLRMETSIPVGDKLQAMLQSGREQHQVSEEALYQAIAIWSRVHGLVSLEIGHQYPVFISDAGEIFRREVEIICSQALEQ